MQPAFVVSSGPRSGLKSQSWNLDAVWCDALLRNLYVRCFANNRRSPCGFAQRELDLRGKSAIGRAQVKIRSGHQLGNRLPVREFCCFPASGKGESRK